MYLCDDVAAMRVVLRLVLEADGAIAVVGEAGDGATAVREIGSLRPDVVVLDLSMPVLDGLEAIPLVRAASPGTRIIVHSGYSAGLMERRALDASAARYIEKGADLEDVRRAVLDLGVRAA